MDDFYRASRTNLEKVGDGAVSESVVKVLSASSSWARFNAVINSINLVSALFYVAMILLNLFSSDVSLQGRLANVLIDGWWGVVSIVIYWFFAKSMSDYATLTKRLLVSRQVEADVAQCFAHSSTFIKTLGIILLLFIGVFILGLMTAVILPMSMSMYILPR